MQNVSVIIPSYNRLEKLRATLTSLYHQTYPDNSYEIIVVDDGSSDGTYEWLEEISTRNTSPAIRFFSQPRQGPASARNLGVRQAVGDYIAFTDDDCIADPKWLESLIKTVGNGNRCVAGGRIVPNDTTGLISAYCTSIGFDCQATEKKATLNALNTANAMCMKSTFIELGGFDTAFRWPGGEDTDFANRLIVNGYVIKTSPDALIVHMNKNTFRGLHSAFFNRGKGHSIIHAKKKPRDFAFFVLICMVKICWNLVRVFVQTPIVGTWNLIIKRMCFTHAYGFAAIDITTKLAKYCGYLFGRLEYGFSSKSFQQTESNTQDSLQHTLEQTRK